ncbi:hypothetical protein GCM10007426_38850 [Alloalcanivorax dieselolei]|nr:hypothetical protein [Alloalcanivorax dieselolei]GGK06457.1 hypothetical protein GCM10007426_38850 [Alloalcanivorax dieselolei]
MSDKWDISVAWLDGYLSALGAINGEIREFFLCAFIMEKTDKESVSEELSDFFSPESTFVCGGVKKVFDWYEYLEGSIKGLIISRPLNITVFDEILQERKSYFALRIMDVVSDVMEKEGEAILYDVVGNFNNEGNGVRFFVVASERFRLVIQFSVDY